MNKFILSFLAIVAMSCRSEPLIFPDISKPDASPDASQGTDGNGTRIVRRMEIVTSSDGLSHERFAGYRDTLRDEDCLPLVSEDTKLRCLPSGHRIETSYFGDAECTIEVVPIFASECISPLPKYATKVVEWANVCIGPGIAVYEFGEEYISSMYKRTMGKCVPAQISNYKPFLLGNKIDPFDFAELKIEMVP